LADIYNAACQPASQVHDICESEIVVLGQCLPVKQMTTQAWALAWQQLKRGLMLSLSRYVLLARKHSTTQPFELT
jgi:hypothetical protein